MRMVRKNMDVPDHATKVGRRALLMPTARLVPPRMNARPNLYVTGFELLAENWHASSTCSTRPHVPGLGRSAMIRDETEYQEASARVADERKRLADHRGRLKEAGLSDEEIKRASILWSRFTFN